MKKNLLLITDVDFWEKGAGHRMRIIELIRFLNKHTKLFVVYIGITSLIDAFQIEKEYNCQLDFLCKEKVLDIEEYGLLLSAYLSLRKFDVCIIEYIHNTYYLQFLSEETITILDTHDFFSSKAKESSLFGYEWSNVEISRELELDIYSVYDFLIIIDQPDYDFLLTYFPATKLLLCPHPASIRPRPIRNKVQSIVFIGSEYLPNRDAIEYFIRECWPAISTNYDVTLSIYGRVCDALNSIDLDSGIMLKGYINDLEYIYDQADIIINPVRFGSGIKIKNIEALSMGLPLITTEHGARGLEKGIGTAFLMANSSAQFVDKLEDLIKNLDLRKQLGLEAIEFISRNFSDDHCFKGILMAIENSF